MNMHRRSVLIGAVALAATPAWAAPTAPILKQIRVVTVGAPNINTFVKWYEALGFSVAERGTVAADLATSWIAPKAVGRKYVVMRAGSPDFFVRAVETDAVPGYKAASTTGWNAFEFVVKDVHATFDKVKTTPFTLIAPPKSLGGKFASIWAMQVKGPAEEVLYLTMDQNDSGTSSLPIATSDIDRVFIAIVAGRDMAAMDAFYKDKLGMTSGVSFDMPVPNLAKPLGLPNDHVFPLLLRRAGAPASNVELDGYPTTAPDRGRAAGQLPPGNAQVSFTVTSLDNLGITLAGPIVTNNSIAYGGKRSATIIGAAGELIELIEE